MEGLDPILAEERRSRRAFAMRMKQLVSSLSTIGYAGLAGGLYDPVLKHQPLRPEHVLATLLSIGLLGACLILAPQTEVDHGRL